MSDARLVRGDRDADPPREELFEFRSILHELKSTGCNLLIVGDVPEYLFTKLSSRLLGDTDIMRYRLLAVTNATVESIAERLPEANETPRRLAETTHIVNHADMPRSTMNVADGPSPSNLEDIPETYVIDPELQGLQRALIEAMDDFATKAGPHGLEASQLRLGFDSLNPLFEHYDADVVIQCLDWVGKGVVEYNGMAHYILREPYNSDRVQLLFEEVDAIVELQVVDSVKHGCESRQRWHFPPHNFTTSWQSV